MRRWTSAMPRLPMQRVMHHNVRSKTVHKVMAVSHITRATTEVMPKEAAISLANRADTIRTTSSTMLKAVASKETTMATGRATSPVSRVADTIISVADMDSRAEDITSNVEAITASRSSAAAISHVSREVITTRADTTNSAALSSAMASRTRMATRHSNSLHRADHASRCVSLRARSRWSMSRDQLTRMHKSA